MRDMRSGNCALCEHNEVIVAPVVDYFHPARGKPASVAREARMFAQSDPYGALTMYVCRSCGYTQSFASEPHKIPVGEKYGTTLITGAAKTPFR